MPPPISDSEPESNDEDVILAKPKSSANKKTNEDAEEDERMADDNGEAAEEEDGEEAEDADAVGEDEDEEVEVYTVEKILNHDFNFPDGQVRYEISWLGYPKKSDRTWETEANLEGAKEILQAYFDSLGGRPVKGDSKPKSETKKRGRKSLAKSESPEEEPAKKQKTEKSTRKSDGKGRGRRKSSPAGGVPLSKPKKGNWEPPKVGPSTWEEGVVAVETIEGDAQDRKFAYLRWADVDETGKQHTSKVRLDTAYIACPQAMLKFYESHLVFTDKSNTNGTS